MKLDFIVTGLPRSRTAWLANYLTYGDVVCLHDALKFCGGNARDLGRVLEGLNGLHGRTGISDAGALLYQDALCEAFPGALWVVVRRPLPDVAASGKRLLGGLSENEERHLQFMHTKMVELIDARKPMVVEFGELDARAEEIAEVCAPGLGMPAWRTRMLCGMNVQVSLEPALKEMRDLAAWEAGGSMRATVEPVKGNGTHLITEANVLFRRRMAEMCAGRQGALEWYESVLEAATVWDHLVDGDGVDAAMADRVFMALVTGWALNPFWQKSYAVMTPVLVNAISAWRFSNRSEAPKAGAYAVYTEVACTMAWLFGGQAGVERWMPELRRLALVLEVEDEQRDGGKK